MAKPNKKPPSTSVDIFCRQCKTQLFRYQKGGKWALIKCFKARITKNYTRTSCTCPSCQTVFARDTLVRGAPAYKMIGTKVYTK